MFVCCIRDPRRDPFAIGRGDIDPLCTGVYGGGGMVFDPLRSGPQFGSGLGGPPLPRLVLLMVYFTYYVVSYFSFYFGLFHQSLQIYFMPLYSIKKLRNSLSIKITSVTLYTYLPSVDVFHLA